MSNLEIKIVTKIIRELGLFLMLNGYREFTLTTKNEETGTTFVIAIDEPTPELLAYMQEKIARERELEVETYGWELVGDIDSQTELEILGLLIDSMEVANKDGKTLITLVRKSRYR